jgi:alginate O-acetyltransferase complex protein AlgI
MIFVSFEFALFFLCTFTLYYIVKKFISWDSAKLVLLVASLTSYSYWFFPYLLILVFSTVVDFVCGQRIHDSSNLRHRRIFLYLSLAGNLGVLGFFKYFNFFSENVGMLLSGFSVDHVMPWNDMLLPIGISFYTFQSMSYTIDIYNGRCQPTKQFRDFALFVSFFPQLIAGPIVRSYQFLPQVMRIRRFAWPMFYWGCFLIILGCFKKLVIADNIAPYVDYFFDLPSYDTTHALTAWIHVVAYAVQILADFSGYTDMALGLAFLLGFRLPFNFYYPYIALGFSDFWQRWNISLSQWFRDYVYINLGGNRGRISTPSQWLTLKNLIITMFLAGLWHGASWMFVLWGLLHGLYLVIDHTLIRHYVFPYVTSQGVGPLIGRMGLRLFTFGAVCWSWVFFRSQSLDQALDITRVMFTHFGEFSLQDAYLRSGQYWGIILAMHLIVLWKMNGRLHRRFKKPVYFISSVLMIGGLLFHRAVEANAFIYFQF